MRVGTQWLHYGTSFLTSATHIHVQAPGCALSTLYIEVYIQTHVGCAVHATRSVAWTQFYAGERMPDDAHAHTPQRGQLTTDTFCRIARPRYPR